MQTSGIYKHSTNNSYLIRNKYFILNKANMSYTKTTEQQLLKSY